MIKVMTKGLIILLKTKLFHLTSQEKKDEVIYLSFIILVASAFAFATLYVFLKLYYLAIKNALTGVLFFIGRIFFKKKWFSKKVIMSCAITCAFIHVFFVVLASGATQSPALLCPQLFLLHH